MRSASTDSKTPYNYAHTSTPKAASSHRYTAAKKNRQTDRSRTRRTHEVPFIVACSHFTRKNTRFRAPASSPKHSPCNIMQPLQCGSQHQLANLHLSTHRTTPEHQMTTVMQPFQCDLQAQIPKHPITTHTSTPKAAWSHRYTAAKKTDKPTAAAPVAHTRYLSSPPAATLHGKTHGFVLRLPPQNIAHATSCSHSNAIWHHSFRKRIELPHPHLPSSPLHSCSHYNAICNHSFRKRIELPRPHLPSSPLPFITTSLPHHFPSSPLPAITTSLPHHFCSSPVPIVTTSLPHHSPSSPLPFVTTSLPHHFPSSPPPFLTTSHRNHFPSSSLPIVTTSLPHHSPSSPLPFVTTSLPHHFPS